MNDLTNRGRSRSHYILTPAMNAFIGKVASSSEPKLIDGPTGTGKSVLACLLHEAGPRKRGPLRQLGCGTLERGLSDAQLCGVMKGAFTGADRDRSGFLGRTNRGTLVLNDIDALPLAVQAKLLGFLDTGRYSPVGSVEERGADVQVIATTNRTPEELVAEGRLREDLYGRLSFVRFTCPSLEQRADRRQLAETVLLNVWGASTPGARESTRDAKPRLAPQALEVLAEHTWWPLNLRGLAQVLGDCIAEARDGVIEADLAQDRLEARVRMWRKLGHERGGTTSRRTLPYKRSGTREREKRAMKEALRDTGGNATRAAKQLGMSRAAFSYKLREHRLDRTSFASDCREGDP